MPEEIQEWVHLNMVAGVGPGRFRKLLEIFGSPRAVLNASVNELAALPGFSETLASEILSDRYVLKAETQLTRAREIGAHIIRFIDSGYPSSLRSLPNAPPILYLRGNQDVLNSPGASVVGTRLASTYGKRVARETGSALALAGITVVSGMASGIDSAAQRGCLEAEGRTIAVLGTGLDVCFPYSSRDIYQNAPLNGAVLSEFPFGEEGWTGNFPARNRIIAALTPLTILIEARPNGGSLITANFAIHEGKTVMVVPGDIFDPRNLGGHTLIVQGARLATTIEDIVHEALSLNRGSNNPLFSATPNCLTEEQQKIYNLLQKSPVHIDDLSQRTGISLPHLLAILTTMETGGLVNQLPGQTFTAIS